MQSKSLALRLRTLAFGFLLVHALGIAHAAYAQGDSPSWNKPLSKEKPKAPAPKPAPPRPRPVTHRPVAPRPSAPPTPVLQPLSVQYRVFKVNPNNTQVEVSPLTVFNPGDRVRFAVKANQELFLYVIEQKGADRNGRIFLPDSVINNGQNLLAKDTEFIVPSNCTSNPTAFGCFYEVDALAGQEYFTFVFSRSPTLSLSNDPSDTGTEIKPQILRQFLISSNQKLDGPRRGDSVFALRVNNLNHATIDDKIIVRYLLNKRGRAAIDAVKK